MNRCDSKRSSYRYLQKLFLGSLLIFSGTFLVRYVSNQCSLIDIQSEVDSAKSQQCKHEMYSFIHLKRETEGKVNCSKIIKGDQNSIDQALIFNLARKKDAARLDELSYLNLTKDCTQFKILRRYVAFPTSSEEKDFPIAYSMVVHDQIGMFERLLRAVYAPQNVYCVHVDAKAPDNFKEAVRSIANCFDNVFVASKLEKVVYASWSRVQADLNCMEDLLQSKVQWRYLLNTCGTDFPLKTNAEMVKVLKVLNGKNNMESETPSSYKQNRWKFHHEVKDYVSQTKVLKSPPPIDTPMFSGNAYFVVSREFVKYIFEEPKVQKLMNWSRDTYSPDEHLWATLNRMPGVPGSSLPNSKYALSDMNALPRMVKWVYNEGDIHKGNAYPKCEGVHRRAVCVYGTGDLNWLMQQHHLFANKFDPEVDDVAIQCIEEYLRYKTIYKKDL
ncbi:beta-1,3-galactosyl-O-glycosyl-glycoprotein beta-1,6-N-acetylglucosaminyltransferase 3-like [Pelobates fuscus]|uniref:beta-1,3-galactosyl-O-glycosyl-glycoprotein beta-1,6-N-acetylglucosaminyltransferase 3-like n=1 Tax=Pelobates fuscus TaxID=191477 RepID=UPI002FE4C4CB